MQKDHISFVADALFAIFEPRPACPPRKVETFPLREITDGQLFEAVLLVKGHDPLLATECQEIYDTAKLTTHQSKVLAMRLGGWTFEEIGRRRGHSKQAAQQIFLQAIKKLARALSVYPYRGLSEVYSGELRRGHG